VGIAGPEHAEVAVVARDNAQYPRFMPTRKFSFEIVNQIPDQDFFIAI